MIKKCVGISFDPTKDDRIVVRTPVDIVHEVGNQYSSKAITVMFDGKVIGHMPEANDEDHAEIFKALPIKAEVHTISKLAEGETFGKFKEGEITHLEVEFPMASDVGNGIPSFNEPDKIIDFNEKEHKYTYNGEELTGGTSYIKRWIKPFNKEMIAGFVAKSLGHKTSEIIAMWDSGGETASLYGKAIHKALEHYDRFHVLGQIMQDKKELEFNKAMPSHPELRKIVQEFQDKFCEHDGEILPEVLVTNVERGLCGYIDRLVVLDWDKKICRVEDYKVNIGSETEDKDKFLGQFADLPPNKLSKYQLQMSFYARLLELSGWTVEGLTAYVYEDEWKRYELDLLKLDF